MAFQLLLRFPGVTQTGCRAASVRGRGCKLLIPNAFVKSPRPSRAFRTTAGFLSVDFRFVDNVM